MTAENEVLAVVERFNRAVNSHDAARPGRARPVQSTRISVSYS